MKVLVLGGTHGNEQLGVSLVELLAAKPIKDVDALIANPKAVAEATRFTQSDLNRSFGESIQKTYESARASELKDIVARYDIVLDFHNTQTPDNDCGFVGVGCDPGLYNILQLFDIKNCIEATYDCINRYCLNTVSIEISVDGKVDEPGYWRQKIIELQACENLPQYTGRTYRFSRRVTWDEKYGYGFTGWKPFVSLGKRDTNILNANGIVSPIFIGSRLTEFYATLVEQQNNEAYACKSERNM